MEVIHFNWVDIVLFVLLLYFAVTSHSFIDTLLEFVGLLAALFTSYALYQPFGSLLHTYTGMPVGISNVVAFFVTWFLAETIIHILIMLFLVLVVIKIRNQRWNRYLGPVGGVIQGSLMFLFFVSLVFSLPVKPSLKNDILESESGPFFVNLAQAYEKRINMVFGKAVEESLSFRTIKPDSGETVDLGFHVDPKSLRINIEAEQTMLTLLNQERQRDGKSQLKSNTELTNVARAYAEQMMEKGFFSHTSQVDNTNVGQRVERANIEYLIVGENLAYAPDVYVAHQGLMNSPGHRHNILSPDYSEIGIGAIDGGDNGVMFVQVFKN